MPKINPFNPNYPVNPGMFVGRLNEILRLESYLFQTRSGQPSNFLITGERGIGKSSIMNYLGFVARGEIPVNENEFNFLVIDTDIDQNTTQLGLVKKIELGLEKELGNSEKARKFLSDTWSFLQRLEVSGFRISPADGSKPDETLLERFAYSLAETVERVCSQIQGMELFNAHYNGVLILIDEADNASRALDLGSFFKLLLERLQRRGCDRVMVGLVGLSELRNVLRESHPSSLRLFEHLELGRLTNDEVIQVIDRYIEKANEDNEEQTQINDEARYFLVAFSEGYHHFIQQFGYSAFAADQDDLIDRDDVVQGALGVGGALELIGDRYYRDNFYNKIQKDSYRQVLRIMADNLDDWVSKKNIRAKFKGKDSTLSNAIKALRDRYIILSKEGTRGIYRLQHKGFALWIKFYTTDPSVLETSIEKNSTAESVA